MNRWSTFPLLFSLLLAWSNTAQSSTPSDNSTQVEQLKEQVRQLDKEFAVLKDVSAARLEAQDKRIADLSLYAANQSNQISAISNQNATVSNHISWTSVGITILVFLAGLITYFSAKSRAEKEAREASTKWFAENAKALRDEIDLLISRASQASREINDHAKKVAKETQETLDHHSESRKQIQAAATAVLQAKASEKTDQNSAQTQAALDTVQRASEELKAKPESEFSSEDHYARGVSMFANANYAAALSSFEAGLANLPAGASSADLARYLFARAVSLGALEKSGEAMALYDQIDQRYGQDTAPALREQVARALVNKGIALGTLDRTEEEMALYDQIDQRYGQDTASALREQVARALFNKGITLGTLDRPEEEMALYDQIDQRYGQDTAPALREQVAKAIFNKGFRLGKLDRTEEAMALYDQIDQRYGQDTAPALREQVARALVNMGYQLGKLDRPEEEMALYDQIDQRYGQDTAPALREQVCAPATPVTPTATSRSKRRSSSPNTSASCSRSWTSRSRRVATSTARTIKAGSRRRSRSSVERRPGNSPGAPGNRRPFFHASELSPSLQVSIGLNR